MRLQTQSTMVGTPIAPPPLGNTTCSYDRSKGARIRRFEKYSYRHQQSSYGGTRPDHLRVYRSTRRDHMSAGPRMILGAANYLIKLEDPVGHQ